jgi:hypothetical protein
MGFAWKIWSPRRNILSGATRLEETTTTHKTSKGITIKRFIPCIAAALSVAIGAPGLANSEILAMMNYETKPADSLKALNLTSPRERREGIAIIDVDPESPAFGKILMDIPLPPDLVAHHIFYDRT